MIHSAGWFSWQRFRTFARVKRTLTFSSSFWKLRMYLPLQRTRGALKQEAGTGPQIAPPVAQRTTCLVASGCGAISARVCV